MERGEIGERVYEKAYRKMSDAEAAEFMDQEFVRRALADAAVQERVPDRSGSEAMKTLAEDFRRMAKDAKISPTDWETIKPWIETKLARADEDVRKTKSGPERAFKEANERHADLIRFRDYLRAKLTESGNERAA